MSAEDFLERPFSGAACTGMCQGAVSNLGSHSVNGTMIRSGSLASASLLTMTQGRIFLISAHLVGSRLTPRPHLDSRKIISVQSPEGGEVLIGAVERRERLCGLSDCLLAGLFALPFESLTDEC